MILTKEMVIEMIKSHIKDYDDRARIAHRFLNESHLESLLERKIALKYVLQDIEEIESFDEDAIAKRFKESTGGTL